MNGIVYLDLKPDYAKLYNLPIKLPVLIEDFTSIDLKKPLPLDLIVRGLKFEYEHTKSDYYKSYLIYFLYEQFKLNLNNGNLERAKLSLGQANSLNDDYRKEFFNGVYLRTIGELKKAEVEFRKSIFKNPHFAYSRFELAKLLYKNEELQDAIEELKKIIETDKNFSLAYNLLSDIYIYQKNYNDAVKTILQGLAIDDNFGPFYEKLTAIYNDAGYFESTVHFYESSKEKVKTHRALYNVGFAYMNLGKLKESIDILESIRNENKDYIYELLSRVYRLYGDYEKALEVSEKGYDLTSSEIVGISYANNLRSVLRLEEAEYIYNKVSENGRLESLFFAYYMYENYFDDERAQRILLEISKRLKGIDRKEKEEYFKEFEYIINKKTVDINKYIKDLDIYLDYYFYIVDDEDFDLSFKDNDLAYNLWIALFFKDDPIFERKVFENCKSFKDKIILLVAGYIVRYITKEGEFNDYILSYLDLKVSSYYVNLNEVLYKIQKNILQLKSEFKDTNDLDSVISNILYSVIFSDSPDDVRGESYLKGYEKLVRLILAFKSKEPVLKDVSDSKSVFIESFVNMINSIKSF
jgi:tetratricopeptide (TPR) repeat protein